MTVRIEIDPALRRHVNNVEYVAVEATTVGEALDALGVVSSFRPIMFAWVGGRAPGTCVFRNRELLKGRYHMKPIREGDVLRLMPAF